MQEVADFLKQIPPDWDAAEKHGRANLVVDSSKTVLKLDEEGTFCKCCQMPYVEDDQMYSLCSDNGELGELGAGFPLFFQFVKYICILMFILSVTYFLPCAVQMYDAYNKLVQAGLDPVDNIFAVFSFGAFITNTDD